VPFSLGLPLAAVVLPAGLGGSREQHIAFAGAGSSVSSAQPHLISAQQFRMLFGPPVFFPLRLALARAKTLRPAPAAVLLPAAAPSGFRLPRQHCKSLATPARCNLPGPPEKARPQAWEQPPLALSRAQAQRAEKE
jgi:hypothetical protein